MKPRLTSTQLQKVTRTRKVRRRRQPQIEFEDRSTPEYRALVQEVLDARDWVVRQRESGNQPD